MNTDSELKVAEVSIFLARLASFCQLGLIEMFKTFRSGTNVHKDAENMKIQ